eukprot:6851112-Pyramimonas_sp.AAC.1
MVRGAFPAGSAEIYEMIVRVAMLFKPNSLGQSRFGELNQYLSSHWLQAVRAWAISAPVAMLRCSWSVVVN